MITFSFKGRNSKEFGIYALEDDRVLRPERSDNEVIIPGRHGSYDFGNNTYRNRLINLQLGILGDYSEQELRVKLRELAYWLDGKGKLVFDDEPDKYYDAKVYDLVPFNIYGTNDFRDLNFNSGTSTVVFSCYPFAKSEIITKELVQGANVLEYKGTAPMPTIIRITNTGRTTIKKIQITHLKKRK